MQVIRDLELMPQIIGQDWSSVFLQRFDGAVTYVEYDSLVAIQTSSHIQSIHPRIKAKVTASYYHAPAH